MIGRSASIQQPLEYLGFGLGPRQGRGRISRLHIPTGKEGKGDGIRVKAPGEPDRAVQGTQGSISHPTDPHPMVPGRGSHLCIPFPAHPASKMNSKTKKAKMCLDSSPRELWEVQIQRNSGKSKSRQILGSPDPEELWEVQIQRRSEKPKSHSSSSECHQERMGWKESDPARTEPMDQQHPRLFLPGKCWIWARWKAWNDTARGRNASGAERFFPQENTSTLRMHHGEMLILSVFSTGYFQLFTPRKSFSGAFYGKPQ